MLLSFFRTFSLKDHTRQLYHAKKDSHGWYSDFTSKRMDHKMNNNGSNYKKKKKKKGNPHMIIDNVILHSSHEGKQKCRKGVILSATAAGMLPKLKDITCACIHLLHLLLIFFCRVPQEKIQWKVESRPYDSNYAKKISEN